MKPSNFSVDPVARNTYSPAAMSTDSVSNTAAAIWLATNRSQMSLYKPVLVPGKKGPHFVGFSPDAGGPDGFVGLLGAFPRLGTPAGGPGDTLARTSGR